MTDGTEQETDAATDAAWRSIPWVPYTNVSMRDFTLCEETGRLMTLHGICPVHGGDACLYAYKHPYDNALDRWKKGMQWTT